MTSNQQRATELVENNWAAPRALAKRFATALDAAEARGRAEGYRAAVKDSHVMCVRIDGCLK